MRPVRPCIILEGSSEETVGLLGTGGAEGPGLGAQRDWGSGLGPCRILRGLAFDLRSTDSATTAATAMTALTATTRQRHGEDGAADLRSTDSATTAATAMTAVTATTRRRHGDDCNGAAAAEPRAPPGPAPDAALAATRRMTAVTATTRRRHGDDCNGAAAAEPRAPPGPAPDAAATRRRLQRRGGGGAPRASGARAGPLSQSIPPPFSASVRRFSPK